MYTKSLWAAFFVAFALLSFSGCAVNRNTEYRSPSEIFIDVTDAVLGIFETTELDDWRNENRSAFERREKWQCENLGESDLRDLGINK